MPTSNDAPPIAWLTEVDARPWNGVALFNMSAAGPVSGPAQDHFDDPLNFLNGRCSQASRDLQADLTAVGTGAGAWTITLLANDLVHILNSAESFLLAQGFGEEAYGWPASAPAPSFVSTIVGGGPAHELTAPANWLRGNLTNQHLALNPLTGAQFYIPSVAFRAQDVITMLRAVSIADADADDNFTNLEHQTNDAYDNGNRRFRFGIDARGRWWCAADQAAGVPPDAIGSFLQDDFQRWAGIKGDEVTQTAVSPIAGAPVLEFIEATYLCESVVAPTRGLRRITPQFNEDTPAVRLTSGEIASNKVMDWNAWGVDWTLDGPKDCTAAGVPFDASTLWINSLLARAPIGTMWTFYQVWGDPRRARFTADVRTDTTGTTPTYDLLGTAELDGYRGRIRARRSISDTTSKQLNWPGLLRRRLFVTTRIEKAED